MISYKRNAAVERRIIRMTAALQGCSEAIVRIAPMTQDDGCDEVIGWVVVAGTQRVFEAMDAGTYMAYERGLHILLGIVRALSRKVALVWDDEFEKHPRMR